VLADHCTINDVPQRLRQWPTWLLGQMHAEAKKVIAARLATEGLGMHEYAALACVEEFAPLSQQEVCDRLGVDRADMVSFVDRLEQAGALVRERDVTDRRRYSLRVTPEGRALLGRADQLIAAATDEYLAALDPEDIEMLRTLALRVLASRAVTKPK
jgi:DNA-binding MarR family transcriptional regulator